MIGGEIYVKKIPSMTIMDIARACVPGAETEVVGVRPGEKLHEELFHGAEPPTPTAIAGIHLATPRVVDHDLLMAQVAKIVAAAEARDSERTLGLVRHLVPEFSGHDDGAAQSGVRTVFTKP